MLAKFPRIGQPGFIKKRENKWFEKQRL